MKRKFTRYPRSIRGSRRIYSASNISDFEITKNGVLVKYNGPGGDVVIPSNVTEIGAQAFKYCDSITSITIPDSVTSIGDWAFAYCHGLTSITIPGSVTEIGDWAFYYCESLTSINVDNNANYASVDGVLFNKDKTVLIACPAGKPDESYTIPNSVTSIEGWAFAWCVNLTIITIPDSVTSIGDKAFFYCSSLESITIPDSVTSIGEDVFEACNNLPQNVKNYISQFYDTFDTYDDEYDDEMSFQEWYRSEEGESDGMEFVDELESLVKSNYDVKEFFEEPSTQGYQGGDFIWITLSDGSKYEFEFDWNDEQVSIYEDGPEVAAKSYFQEIQAGIDSGSALVEE